MRKILKLILKITLGVIKKLLILLAIAIAVVIIWLLFNSDINAYLH